MPKDKNDDLLLKWQHLLGLDDWRIKLVADCLPSEMELQNCSGCTDWEESIKTARIQILDPKHYGERIVPFNAEKTLIHELLHLKFSLLGESGNDLQDKYVHQIIDDLARAFCEVSRKEVIN